MKETSNPIKRHQAERGGVLITVLIVATVFAVLAFITLQVSLHSLESTDRHANAYQSRLAAESAVESAAALVRQDFGVDPDALPVYIEPEFALSVSDDFLRTQLIDSGSTTENQVGNSPIVYERTAYTTLSNVSTYSSDTDIIPGTQEEVYFEYIDDESFSENYPGYEFNPVHSEGDMVVYGVGEVPELDGDTTVFSFLQGLYPNDQYNYQVREAGITEESRLGNFPYIETEHPYGNDQNRAWTVTYQSDPSNTGRNITDLRLMANLNEVGIDATDILYISKWLEDQDRFQYVPEMVLPGQVLAGGYWNTLDEVFSPRLDTHTIGLFLRTDAAVTDYGFRVAGVRYGFDHDEFGTYYETPHPYDEIVPQASAARLNIQTIYCPYQRPPLTPVAGVESMRIKFDDQFSLDPGDQLLLLNASDPGALVPEAVYTAVSPPPADGWSPYFDRIDSGFPLGIVMILDRNHSGDSDGTADYGYKVVEMEYTDRYGNWNTMRNPVIESPHNIYLGDNSGAFGIPAFTSFAPPPPANYTGYQTIYQPFCPNVDDPTGVGTVDNWAVTFGDSCDLTATSAAANTDYIRITTPGNILTFAPLLSDTIYFVHPDGVIPVDGNQYRDINDLRGYTIDCGLAPLLELEFLSDPIDAHENTLNNYGYRVLLTEYDTSDGADDDRTPPTIRTDVSFPTNDAYPAYGNGPYLYSEWWYTNTTGSPDPLFIGLHFDRFNYALDPGDRIEIYDESGILVATLVSDSVNTGPEAGGPVNPDLPGGQEQPENDPNVGGPYLPDDPYQQTLIDLESTFGWVLVPGKTAQVRLVGDGDDNEGYSGFEIDHCAYVNGDVPALRDYITEYTEVAYGDYYDRTSEALNAFRSIGTE